MAFQNFPTVGKSLSFMRLLLCVLLCLVVARGAQAQQALYQNTSDSEYFSPGSAGQSHPPQIDATAFDNESIFSVTFNVSGYSPNLYETSDTLFYTNNDNGIMIANSPVVTNLLNGNFLLGQSYGSGFQFDYKTSSGKKMADTFYNSGTIRCNSILDGNNTYNLGGAFGLFYFLVSVGTCNISATNIYNPGNIQLGVDSLLQMTGQNVDLSRSVLTIEPALPTFAGLFSFLNSSLYDNVTFSSTGATGTDTNADWNPGGLVFTGTSIIPVLSPTNAFSSFPDNLTLTNSGAYVKVDGLGTLNVIHRSVFVQNNSPANVGYNVYIAPPNASSPLDPFLGQGAAHVEWVGSYIDPATGIAVTNYLYLTDDYLLGASTNVAVIGGVPDNFTFRASTTKLLFNPLPQGFEGFPDGAISNSYSYMNGQIIASSVVTNVTIQNANGSITNLYGRIQINASKELNLNNAIISGQNYLSIQATNQFDGSAGAQIASPYSDINVGVTNGSLSVSNLLQFAIPNWNGTIQAWSTRWISVDATTGVTNDYRVLLVFSQLQPTTQPWVQNLKMHTGNSLVISDVLNVYGSLFTDAQNLTITTNGVGLGATSTAGELNSFISGNIGPTQMPNLRWVTNNGAMRSLGLFTFTNLNSFINAGLISDQGTFMYATNFVNAGAISNGVGNFTLQSLSSVLTNGSVIAAGKISLAGSSLVLSNEMLQCLALSLNPTNQLTDANGPFGNTNNGNIWVVGRTNGTGGGGFSLLNNPNNGDLLGTTISNICPPANKLILNTWSGRNVGASNSGFTNNAALGRLILDVVGGSSLITFNGTGTNNALYVDSLEFRDTLTNGVVNSYEFTNWLSLNTNIVIYFAQAYINGVSVADKINIASLNSGKNGGRVVNGVVTPGRLRWVPTYAGIFSSTNLVIGGVTNTVNAGLAQSTLIDSDGDGIVNAYDPTPFFSQQQLNFTLTLTNQPSRLALLSWNTIPFATNYVYYRASLLTNTWQLYTSFLSTNVAGSSYTVTASDTNVLKGVRFYQVLVQPWLTYPY